MKRAGTFLLLVFICGIARPSLAYPIVQTAACVNTSAATPIVCSGYSTGSTFQTCSGTDMMPLSAQLSVANPETLGAYAEFVKGNAPVPAPTAAALGLVGSALVVIGLGHRKRTVHIQIN